MLTFKGVTQQIQQNSNPCNSSCSFLRSLNPQPRGPRPASITTLLSLAVTSLSQPTRLSRMPFLHFVGFLIHHLPPEDHLASHYNFRYQFPPPAFFGDRHWICVTLTTRKVSQIGKITSNRLQLQPGRGGPPVVGFGINNPTNSAVSCGIPQVCFSDSSLDCPDRFQLRRKGDRESGREHEVPAGMMTEMKINTFKH